MTFEEFEKKECLRLGGKIKKIRKENNLTQQELADLLGIHRVTLTKIETGNKKISLNIQYKICELFNLEYL